MAQKKQLSLPLILAVVGVLFGLVLTLQIFFPETSLLKTQVDRFDNGGAAFAPGADPAPNAEAIYNMCVEAASRRADRCKAGAGVAFNDCLTGIDTTLEPEVQIEHHEICRAANDTRLQECDSRYTEDFHACLDLYDN